MQAVHIFCVQIGIHGYSGEIHILRVSVAEQSAGKFYIVLYLISTHNKQSTSILIINYPTRASFLFSQCCIETLMTDKRF